MKLAILLPGIFLIACQGASQPHTLKVAVLDTPLGHPHSRNVIRVIESNYSASCRLEVELFPIYERGNLTVPRFLSALRKSREFSPVITNISWNTLYHEAYEPIVRELRKVSQTGFLVTAGGQDLSPHGIHALSDTVMGKVPGALVIGALSEDGRLARRSVHGELLTALPAPDGTLGSSFSAALFTGKLAERVCWNNAFDWSVLMDNKRNASEKYPTLEELLGN